MAAFRARSDQVRRQAVLRRCLASAGIASLVAICLVFAATMRDARHAAGQAAVASATNLTTSLAHDMDRNIEILDLALQALVRSWIDPRVRALSPDLRDQVLFDSASKAQGFGGVFVLDETGTIRASSVPSTSAQGAFADRDYFLVHKGSSGLGLFISKPIVSRITHKWVLALSRRITNPDGSFGGVVASTLELSYVDKLFSGQELDETTVAALLRTDGTVLARAPSSDGDIGMTLAHTDAFNRIRSTRAGSFEGASGFDGSASVISFRRVGFLPLIQVVEISADDAYAAWRSKAIVLGSILLGLCVASGTLLLLFGRELARRVKAEAALETLARTDALTKLANRRHFDESLDGEWRRAARAGVSLSLLMIDADHFKAYNDHFGHPAGDQLLIQIAQCIRDQVHRPGDLPCRIGGEEFAVLLPETGADGAFAVAENIRWAVLNLGATHPTALSGVASVSIGIATIVPVLTQSSEVLTEAADAALYAAKRDGRNRVNAGSVRKHLSLVA